MLYHSKKTVAALLVLALTLACLGALPAGAEAAGADPVEQALPYWSVGAPGLASVQAFVEAVTDPDSEDYRSPGDRIAVFDFDGTLYGERFPTYFDTCLFLHRALHANAGVYGDLAVREPAQDVVLLGEAGERDEGIPQL